MSLDNNNFNELNDTYKEKGLFTLTKKEISFLDNVINKHYRGSTLDERDERSPFDLIPYAIGSFNEDMNPTQDKVKYLFKRVQSKHSTIHCIEGGVRGGKDVFGLSVWARVLMTSQEKTHLALGTSLEHVIRTVFVSDGFGLKNLIPHGRLVRDNEGGGFRAVFRFKNIYGEDREVIFYGNYKKDDYKKYQGFTIGTVYINEGILQHINGIQEAFQRMFSSKDGIVIITQNPVGTAHDFYQKLEKNYMLSQKELDFIELVQSDDLIKKKWEVFKKRIKQKIKFAIDKAKQEFLDEHNRSELEELKEVEQEQFKLLAFKIMNEIQNGNEENINGVKTYNYGLYSAPIEEFIELPKELLDSDTKLKGASMHKIMNYDKGFGENPNKVINGFNYSYYHFTMEDNIGMNDMQRNEARRQFQKGTSTYEQRVEGIRVSSDGLLLPEFTDANIIYTPMEEFEEILNFKSPNRLRVISIDPAYNHPAGIVDCDVDLENGKIYQLGERKVEMKDFELKDRNSIPLENAVLELVRERRNRKMPDMLIIDPSHVATLSYFTNEGYNVMRADNETQSAKPYETAYGEKTVKKHEKGIDLLKQGFFRLKFFIHIDCPETIKEMQNMAVKFNETTGNDDIIKINDDMFDAFKYVANTTGINPDLWKESEVLENYEQQLLQDETRKNEEWNLGGEEAKKRIRQRVEELKRKNNKGTNFNSNEEWWIN